MNSIIGNVSQKKQIVNWVKDKNAKLIIITGDTGTGKTLLAHKLFEVYNIDSLSFDFSCKQNTKKMMEQIKSFGDSILYKMTHVNKRVKGVIIDELEILHEHINIKDITELLLKLDNFKAIYITSELNIINKKIDTNVESITMKIPSKNTLKKFFIDKCPNLSSKDIVSNDMRQLSISIESCNKESVDKVETEARHILSRYWRIKDKSMKERVRIFSNNTTNVNSMIHRNYIMCSSDGDIQKIANILSEGDSTKNVDWQYFIMLMCLYPLHFMKQHDTTKLENGNIWSKLSYQKSRAKLLCKCKNILAQNGIPIGDIVYIRHLRTMGYLEKNVPKNTMKLFHELCR